MRVLGPVLIAMVVPLLGLCGCQGLGDDDDNASVRFPMTVSGDVHDVSFVFGEPVHEIDVIECTDGCSMRDEYCSFQAGLAVWTMGVGSSEPDPSGPDDARRLPPTLKGPLEYGVLSPAAGFATEAAPLTEGALYSVEVDVYGFHDDDPPVRAHIDRYACAYFTVESSKLVSVSE